MYFHILCHQHHIHIIFISFILSFACQWVGWAVQAKFKGYCCIMENRVIQLRLRYLTIILSVVEIKLSFCVTVYSLLLVRLLQFR